MAQDADQDLRSKLLTALGATYSGAGKIAQNNTAQNTEFPYVWFARSSDFVERNDDGSRNLRTLVFDLEIVSDDIDEALSLAAEVKECLDGYSGDIGSDNFAYECYCTDHTDDYVVRSSDDVGLHVAALSVEFLMP